MTVSREDARASITERPLRRLVAELYCLSHVFVPTEANNNARKVGTVLVVLAWAMIEVGSAYGVAELPEQFFYIRVFVGVLIGRMWGIQINNFAGVEFTPIKGGQGEGQGQDGENDGD